MRKESSELMGLLEKELVHIIAETNGIYVYETLGLLEHVPSICDNPTALKTVQEFKHLLISHQGDEVDLKTLLDHPMSGAFFHFFKSFPLPFNEEHIHLTGSLSSDFLFPRLQKILKGPKRKLIEKKIKEIYGEEALPIKTKEDLAELIRLRDNDLFDRYLKILFLPKLVLNSKKAHEEAAYFLAQELYQKYNVGSIRLKFTLSRGTSIKDEQIPGLDSVSEDDVVLGLYQGFKKFQAQNPWFRFQLSPSFRKEEDFFDASRFKTKNDSFLHQVEVILNLIEKYPYLRDVMCEVDTVGSEKELYRKAHFLGMKKGLRKLQYAGFKIRSHHGETWKTLKQGVQAVDNAMNIWQVDTLEHGLSLGINPNYYYHRIFQNVLGLNEKGLPIKEDRPEFLELQDLEWEDESVLRKILKGQKLTPNEVTSFIKTKFFTAREVEQYQHDVLNRMIQKNVSLVALPSSNMKLTGHFPDYRIHPFSWWEKKGVTLGIGTDNFVTLGTNYIQELLMLLYSDPQNLKISKILMVATRETRRAYLSSLLWQMRKEITRAEE